MASPYTLRRSFAEVNAINIRALHWFETRSTTGVPVVVPPVRLPLASEAPPSKSPRPPAPKKRVSAQRTPNASATSTPRLGNIDASLQETEHSTAAPRDQVVTTKTRGQSHSAGTQVDGRRATMRNATCQTQSIEELFAEYLKAHKGAEKAASKVAPTDAVKPNKSVASEKPHQQMSPAKQRDVLDQEQPVTVVHGEPRQLGQSPPEFLEVVCRMREVEDDEERCRKLQVNISRDARARTFREFTDGRAQIEAVEVLSARLRNRQAERKEKIRAHQRTEALQWLSGSAESPLRRRGDPGVA